MTTITLPETEETVAQQARRQGTTELLTPDVLRKTYPPANDPAGKRSGTSLFGLLSDHIGTIHSSEHVPCEAQMAADSGRKFAGGMARKRREGRL